MSSWYRSVPVNTTLVALDRNFVYIYCKLLIICQIPIFTFFRQCMQWSRSPTVTVITLLACLSVHTLSGNVITQKVFNLEIKHRWMTRNGWYQYIFWGQKVKVKVKVTWSVHISFDVITHQVFNVDLETSYFMEDKERKTPVDFGVKRSISRSKWHILFTLCCNLITQKRFFLESSYFLNWWRTTCRFKGQKFKVILRFSIHS